MRTRMLRLLARWVMVSASLAVLLFVSAGTVRITSIRNYLVAFSLLLLVTMLAVDPSLAQERANPGEPGIGNSRVATGLLFLLTLAVAGFSLGHLPSRFNVPVRIRYLALGLFILSAAFQTWAMIVNPFFSPVLRIQTERRHHLILTGPYRLIRHPGYFAMSIAVPASALSIGSWLALAPAAGFVAIIVRRARVEDEFLVRNLHGYKQYASLVPSGLPWTTTTRAETNS
jgi:protein-S-isoprenylcysteine O-methyltransferase Ste14